MDRDVAKTLEDLNVQPRSLRDMARIVVNPYITFQVIDKEYITREVHIPDLVPVDD